MYIEKKNIRQLLLTALILVALPVAVIVVKQYQDLRTSAAPGNATLLINPPTQTVNVGQTGTASVFINPNAEQVSGIELVITYDSTVVQVDDIVAGEFFTDPSATVGQPLVITKSIANNRIHFAVAFPLGSNYSSIEAKNAATISFSALSSGTSNLNFVVSGQPSTIISDINASNVIDYDNVVNGTINVSSGARLYFSEPRPVNPQTAGNSFDIDVLVDTSGQDTDGVDARIQFDRTILRITNLVRGTETNFTSYPSLTYDNALGTVSISANIGTGTSVTPVNGSAINIGTISFSTLTQSAGSLITYDFTPGSRNDSNIVLSGTSQSGDPTDILASVTNANIVVNAISTTPTLSPTATPAPTNTPTPTLTPSPIPTTAPGTPTPTAAPTATPTLTPAPTNTPTPTLTLTPTTVPPKTVILKFLFQGRTRSGADNSKQITVVYRTQENSIVNTVNTTTSSTGEAQISLEPGNYIYLVRAPGYLAHRYGNLVTPISVSGTTSTIDLSSIPLLGGDFNTDGEVNEVDYAAQFLPAFRTSNATADLDGSGEVNNLDFGIMRANWNLRSDTI